MIWWLWWLVWTIVLLILAAWLWHKLESTRAMSWWDIHYEKEKAKRRRILEITWGKGRQRSSKKKMEIKAPE